MGSGRRTPISPRRAISASLTVVPSAGSTVMKTDRFGAVLVLALPMSTQHVLDQTGPQRRNEPLAAGQRSSTNRVPECWKHARDGDHRCSGISSCGNHKVHLDTCAADVPMAALSAMPLAAHKAAAPQAYLTRAGSEPRRL